MEMGCQEVWKWKTFRNHCSGGKSKSCVQATTHFGSSFRTCWRMTPHQDRPGETDPLISTNFPSHKENFSHNSNIIVWDNYRSAISETVLYASLKELLHVIHNPVLGRSSKQNRWEGSGLHQSVQLRMTHVMASWLLYQPKIHKCLCTVQLQREGERERDETSHRQWFMHGSKHVSPETNVKSNVETNEGEEVATLN